MVLKFDDNDNNIEELREKQIDDSYTSNEDLKFVKTADKLSPPSSKVPLRPTTGHNEEFDTDEENLKVDLLDEEEPPPPEKKRKISDAAEQEKDEIEHQILREEAYEDYHNWWDDNKAEDYKESKFADEEQNYEQEMNDYTYDRSTLY